MQTGPQALPEVSGEERADVLVIGAGIVGLAAGARLQGEGRRVLVVDRKGVGEETSRGNAGAFAFPNILPLASPAAIRSTPRWLLDPLGPLALRPAYLPRLAPWLLRFWRASWPDRVRASTEAQASLMALSAAETGPLLEAAGAMSVLMGEGSLQLYESQGEFRASLPGWQVRAEHGIPFEHLHGTDAIAAVQPGLDPRFVAATLVPGWRTVTDPQDVCLALARSIEERGGAIRRAAVRALVPEEAGVRVDLSGGRTLQAAQVVLAAGAWSHHLARSLGDRIPLESERGYNTTLPAPGFDLRLLLVFGEHGFVATPLATGIRVGGAVEFAGLDAPPNFKRADAMLEKARRFLPGLRTEGGRQWMGHRPSLPDSLPVIGYAPQSRRVVYAFGHGHLGLTQSAGTARLVADLLQDRPPPLDLAPFRPGRFAGVW